MKVKFFLLFVAAIVLSGCVSLGRFEEMQSQRDALQQSLDSLKNVVASMQATIDRLRNDSTAFQNSIGIKNIRIENLSDLVDSLKARMLALQTDMDITNQNYEQSKTKNSARINKLLDSLNALQKDVALREQKLKEFEEALTARDSSLAVLQKDLILREQRMGDLQKKLSARDSALNSLKLRLNDALFGFTNSGLSINIVNGRVYVSLSNQLLFSTGRTDIDKRGKEALLGLARVLNSQTDLSILVEGHTDNQAVINLGAIKDNWDLSVLRATEVVRYLTMEGKVDPKRTTASGRSEYFPVDIANTTESRAKNRRTEIILIPKLSELFEIIGK